MVFTRLEKSFVNVKLGVTFLLFLPFFRTFQISKTTSEKYSVHQSVVDNLFMDKYRTKLSSNPSKCLKNLSKILKKVTSIWLQKRI